MKFTPHPYQTIAIDRIVANTHYGLLLDMGLGKSICTLMAINQLINNRFEVTKYY